MALAYERGKPPPGANVPLVSMLIILRPAPNDSIDSRLSLAALEHRFRFQSPIYTIESVLESHGPRASFEFSLVLIRHRLNHSVKIQRKYYKSILTLNAARGQPRG